MRLFLLFVAGIFVFLPTVSRAQEVIQLTHRQIEAIFLKQNLQLIAEQMQIGIADAQIAQAKLWENPELFISDLNLWSSNSQREGEKQVISPLFGSFGRNTQFSVELSQLIYTAHKKRKEVRKEKVSKEIAIREFENLLRNLKTELRKTLHETVYLQSYLRVAKEQHHSLIHLINAYQKQVVSGNLAKHELLRLQSSGMEQEHEISEIQTALNEYHKQIKALLCTEPFISIEIIPSEKPLIAPENLNLASLMEQSKKSRPDVQQQQLQALYFDKVIAVEKAQRIPDLTLSASYDRRGGVWRDFVGFGVSFSLPVLNRNQGNLKIARLSKQQSEYLARQQELLVQHEVVQAFENYKQTYDFYQKIVHNELLSELDSMLGSYTRNLLKKNISMLEYLDFMESYKANKQTVLSAHKNAAVLFEALQHSTGTELKTE